jgi:hypothetical protein
VVGPDIALVYRAEIGALGTEILTKMLEDRASDVGRGSNPGPTDYQAEGLNGHVLAGICLCRNVFDGL